jgi:hypothetical protein
LIETALTARIGAEAGEPQNLVAKLLVLVQPVVERRRLIWK